MSSRKCLKTVFLVIAAVSLYNYGYKDMEHARRVARLLGESRMNFDTGGLEGGTAVYHPERDLAFWVKGVTTYAVNERARQAAPDLTPAPESVSYEAVYQATLRSGGGHSRVSTIALTGNKMTADEAEQLEELIRSQPGDLWARKMLLGYYFSKTGTDESARKNQGQHVLWLVENAPQAAIVGSPWSELCPKVSPEAYARAKEMLKGHVDREPQNLRLLENASRFFTRHDPAFAIEYMRKCIQIEPDNPKWHERLAHLQTLHSDKLEEASFETAIVSLERALELTRDKSQQVSLLAKIAKTVFDDGDVEKARSRAQEVLDRIGTFNRGSHADHLNAAHTVLGRIALLDGDMETAKKHLLDSARNGGSPVLSSFGPGMELAAELLAQGERETVIKYLKLCTTFWEKPVVKEWVAAIQRGENPELKRFCS